MLVTGMYVRIYAIEDVYDGTVMCWNDIFITITTDTEVTYVIPWTSIKCIEVIEDGEG